MIEKFQYWQIVVLLTTLVVLFSGFMPIVSVDGYGVSLVDVFGSLLGGTGDGASDDSSLIPTSQLLQIGVGVMVSLVMYPIAVILGFVALSWRTRDFVVMAGIFGLICWIGALWAASAIRTWLFQMWGGLLSGMVQYGMGIYLGLIGSIVLMITYILRPRARMEIPAETAAKKKDENAEEA